MTSNLTHCEKKETCFQNGMLGYTFLDNVVQEKMHFHAGNGLGKQVLIQSILLKWESAVHHSPGTHGDFGVQSQHAVLPLFCRLSMFAKISLNNYNIGYPSRSFQVGEGVQYYRHRLHSQPTAENKQKRKLFLSQWREFWLQENVDFMIFPASSPLLIRLRQKLAPGCFLLTIRCPCSPRRGVG